jgi:membrane protein implicated in regulation of membrane protease activity
MSKGPVKSVRYVVVPYNEFGGAGSLGSIYVREPGRPPKWIRIIERARAQKKGKGKPAKAPEFLNVFEAQNYQLICTGVKPKDQKSRHKKFNAPPEYYCRYVTPDGLENVEAEIQAVVYFVADDEHAPWRLFLHDRIKDLAGQKVQDVDKLVESASKFAKWALREGSEPDVAGGGSSPAVLFNFSGGIAAAVEDGSLTAAGCSAAASSLQCVMESVSVGWSTIAHSVAIHKLNQKISTETDSDLLKQLKKKRSEHVRELSIIVGKSSSPITNGVYSVMSGIAAQNTTILDSMKSALGAAGSAAAFSGTVVDIAVAARNFRQGVQSKSLQRKFLKLTDSIKQAAGGTEGGGSIQSELVLPDDQDLYELKEGEVPKPSDKPREFDEGALGTLSVYVNQKLERRIVRKEATGGLAIVGALGGIAGGVGALVAGGIITMAAVNFWNPLGWALGSVALVGGAAISIYLLHRRITRKKRHEKRRARNKIANAREFAARLLAFHARHMDQKDPLYDKATALVQLFGVDSSEFIQGGTVDKGAYAHAVEKITSKFAT